MQRKVRFYNLYFNRQARVEHDRSSLGIDAASSFIQGYWIWQKIIENLAIVGYDPNNLLLAAYDWRLSYWNLEERDGYFSRMKTSIEEMRYGFQHNAIDIGDTSLIIFVDLKQTSRREGRSCCSFNG